MYTYTFNNYKSNPRSQKIFIYSKVDNFPFSLYPIGVILSSNFVFCCYSKLSWAILSANQPRSEQRWGSFWRNFTSESSRHIVLLNSSTDENYYKSDKKELVQPALYKFAVKNTPWNKLCEKMNNMNKNNNIPLSQLPASANRRECSWESWYEPLVCSVSDIYLCVTLDVVNREL